MGDSSKQSFQRCTGTFSSNICTKDQTTESNYTLHTTEREEANSKRRSSQSSLILTCHKKSIEHRSSAYPRVVTCCAPVRSCFLVFHSFEENILVVGENKLCTFKVVRISSVCFSCFCFTFSSFSVVLLFAVSLIARKWQQRLLQSSSQESFDRKAARMSTT